MLLGEPFHKIPSIVSEVIYRKKGKNWHKACDFLDKSQRSLGGHSSVYAIRHGDDV